MSTQLQAIASAYKARHHQTVYRLCRAFLATYPYNPDAMNYLALSLNALRKSSAALACLKEGIAHNPNNAALMGNIGHVYTAMGEYDKALECFKRFEKHFPPSHLMYNNLGHTCATLCRYDEAIAYFTKAQALKPDYEKTLCNLAVTYRDMNRLEEAEETCERALRIRPGFAEAQFVLATIHLLKNDYAQGLNEYESRWHLKQSTPLSSPRPRWDGKASLNGKRILMVSEQGFGDTVQFARYAKQVKELGAYTIITTRPELVSLFGHYPCIDLVVDRRNRLPQFDCYLPLMSFPLLLGTTAETIPPCNKMSVPVKQSIQAEIRRHPARKKIGIVWKGSPTNVGDRKRSCGLQWFKDIAQLPEVKLFSLYKGQGTEELTNADFPIIDLSSHLNDFLDTAAAINDLDLVITVDTAVAHIAGTLEKKVWVALPYVPDWRWGLTGENTRWYPSMKLFRQKELNRWEDVFKEIKNKLESEI